MEALKTEDSKLDSLVGSSIEEAQTKIWTTNGLHDDEHCKVSESCMSLFKGYEVVASVGRV